MSEPKETKKPKPGSLDRKQRFFDATDSEWEWLEEEAQKLGMKRADFIRMMLFDRDWGERLARGLSKFLPEQLPVDEHRQMLHAVLLQNELLEQAYIDASKTDEYNKIKLKVDNLLTFPVRSRK
jgi:hypothetical protein